VALAPEQLHAFARHLLLPEIGREGQERLCDTQVRVRPGADRGSAEVAVDYLRRGGVAVVDDPSAAPCPVPDAEAVRRLAGSDRMVPAAEALVGALAAVEMVKAVVGAGQPGGRTDALVLDEGTS